MAKIILMAFILVPIIEIVVFIEIGGLVGVGNTVLMIAITAIFGTWLLRAQGFQTLARARSSLDQNIFPVSEVFDGICLLIAGALLLTPGFVTDALGLFLFIPHFRRILHLWIWNKLAHNKHHSSWTTDHSPIRQDGGLNRPSQPETIDGKFREIDKEDP